MKWTLFSLASLILSHSFLAYFVGTQALEQMVRSTPAQNPSAFLAMLSMFALVLFDFGWFREQFCTVVCPYGRFQSVLMDERSLVIAYHSERGEPRRGWTGSSEKEHGIVERAALAPPPLHAPKLPSGDCVNCYRCVQVCPTGIDIRRGVQLECIACTACVDACDEVMSKLKKPPGLIRYTRENSKLTSPRAWSYLAVLCVLLLGLVYTLAHRKEVELTLIRASEAPYQVTGPGTVSNHFKLDLRNQSFEDLLISVELDPEQRSQGANVVLSNFQRKIGAGQPERADLFVQFDRAELVAGRGRALIRLQAISAPGLVVQSEIQEVPLVGPYR